MALPVSSGDRSGNRLDLGLDGVGDLQQGAAAIAGRHHPPRLEGGGGHPDGPVHIHIGRARNLRNRRFSGRILDFDEAAVRGFGGLASDEHQVTGDGRALGEGGHGV